MDFYSFFFLIPFPYRDIQVFGSYITSSFTIVKMLQVTTKLLFSESKWSVF